MKEETFLDGMGQGTEGFESMELGRVSQGDNRDLSSVSILQPIQGNTQIKTTAVGQMRRQFVSAKQMQESLKKGKIFLCTIREDNNGSTGSRCRGNGNNSSPIGAGKAQVSMEMIENAKRKMSVIVGPKRESLTLQEHKTEAVENVGVQRREDFQIAIVKYHDI